MARRASPAATAPTAMCSGSTAPPEDWDAVVPGAYDGVLQSDGLTQSAGLPAGMKFTPAKPKFKKGPVEITKNDDGSYTVKVFSVTANVDPNTGESSFESGEVSAGAVSVGINSNAEISASAEVSTSTEVVGQKVEVGGTATATLTVEPDSTTKTIGRLDIGVQAWAKVKSCFGTLSEEITIFGRSVMLGFGIGASDGMRTHDTRLEEAANAH